MATIADILTKIRARLASLNTKTGRSDTDLNAAIDALPSKKTADNVTSSGATVTTPAGIYFSQVQQSVTTASRAGTSITTAADATNDKLTLTASNNQSTGYVTGSNQTASKVITLTADGATVTATDNSSPPVAVSKSVTTATRASTTLSSTQSNNTLVFTAGNNQATGYVAGSDSTATKTVYLSTSGATVTASDGTNSISSTIGSGSATIPPTTITANPSLATTVTSGKGYKMSVSKSQTVSPSVTAGYISSGTAGTITVSGEGYVAESSTGIATASTSDTATRTIGYGQQTTIGEGYYPSARIIRNSTESAGDIHVYLHGSNKKVEFTDGKVHDETVVEIRQETPTVDPKYTTETYNATNGFVITSFTVNAIPVKDTWPATIRCYGGNNGGIFTIKYTDQTGTVNSVTCTRNGSVTINVAINSIVRVTHNSGYILRTSSVSEVPECYPITHNTTEQALWFGESSSRPNMRWDVYANSTATCTVKISAEDYYGDVTVKYINSSLVQVTATVTNGSVASYNVLCGSEIKVFDESGYTNSFLESNLWSPRYCADDKYFAYIVPSYPNMTYTITMSRD